MFICLMLKLGLKDCNFVFTPLNIELQKNRIKCIKPWWSLGQGPIVQALYGPEFLMSALKSNKFNTELFKKCSKLVTTALPLPIFILVFHKS